MLSPQQTVWYSTNKDQHSVKAPESTAMVSSCGLNAGMESEISRRMDWAVIKLGWSEMCDRFKNRYILLYFCSYMSLSHLLSFSALKFTRILCSIRDQKEGK